MLLICKFFSKCGKITHVCQITKLYFSLFVEGFKSGANKEIQRIHDNISGIDDNDIVYFFHKPYNIVNF